MKRFIARSLDRIFGFFRNYGEIFLMVLLTWSCTSGLMFLQIMLCGGTPTGRAAIIAVSVVPLMAAFVCVAYGIINVVIDSWPKLLMWIERNKN